MTVNQNSPELLREEILAKARKEAEKIVLLARQEAGAISANAEAEANRVRQEQLDETRTEAERQSELILATVLVETGRLRSARVEELLGSLYEEVCQKLEAREGFDYRQTVVSLASEAINRMAGDTFIVKISGTDNVLLGNDMTRDIAGLVGRPVTITLAEGNDMTGGGVIVEDGDGRQAWDNRLLKRLERLWPEIRRQIAIEAAFVPKISASGGDTP